MFEEKLALTEEWDKTFPQSDKLEQFFEKNMK